MRKALSLALVLCCVSAGALWGAVGELRAISVHPRKLASAGLDPQPIYTRSLVVAPEGCGTVRRRAWVARLVAGGIKVSVALDSIEADAEHPDVVRLDFAGTCRFQGAPTMPLKRGMGERRSSRTGGSSARNLVPTPATANASVTSGTVKSVISPQRT